MADASFPLVDADLCVKCGLCLPHCPTYLDSRNEADSPRGRIALMQGLASGLIPQTPKLEQHLDGCLNCRACETVCPPKVPYGRLIDSGRALMTVRRPARARRLAPVAGLLKRRALRALIRGLLRVYQRSGAQALLRRLGLLGRGRLARLESLLPEIFPGQLQHPESLPSTKGREEGLGDAQGGSASTEHVQLFVGCVGDIAERAVIADAQQLFAACGYTLEVPRAQTCCGALDQHGGRAQPARECAQRNLAAFAGDAPITALASGCGASLADYAWMLDAPEARAFAARLRDPSRLLLARAQHLDFAPLRARVAIHAPCTQVNVLRDAAATRELLAHIPEIDLFDLDPAQRCCGAAGLHFVTDPAGADRFLAPKIAAARAQRPDFIVSANIGCTLHLAGGLRRAGLKVPVLHPLSLLAAQLERPRGR